MSPTERAKIRFTVKETGDSSWIAIEPVGAGPLLKGVILGFDLRAGTSHAEAQKIAAYLDSKITGVISSEKQ